MAAPTKARSSVLGLCWLAMWVLVAGSLVPAAPTPRCIQCGAGTHPTPHHCSAATHHMWGDPLSGGGVGHHETNAARGCDPPPQALRLRGFRLRGGGAEDGTGSLRGGGRGGEGEGGRGGGVGGLAVTVSTHDCSKIERVTIRKEGTVRELKEMVEGLFGVAAERQLLTCMGTPLDDEQSIGESVGKDCLVILSVSSAPHASQRHHHQPVVDSASLQQMLASATIASRTPQAADLRGSRDELDSEVQQRELERIHKLNVDDNLHQALEHHPEAFGKVSMLFVRCFINKMQVLAMVDTGAQMTVMSEKCAHRMGLLHLVDRRFTGIASGVGQSRILGRVHVAPLRLGKTFVAASITVLEDTKHGTVDLLLGLDNMLRHQCVLDLKAGVMRFAGANGDDDEVALEQCSTQDISAAGGAHNGCDDEGDGGGVASLMDMGCTEEEAKGALEATRGDKEAAVELLFGDAEREGCS